MRNLINYEGRLINNKRRNRERDDGQMFLMYTTPNDDVYIPMMVVVV